VLRGPNTNGDAVASIHDMVVFKQEGLDQRLGYDTWARNSLVDHFYAENVSREAVVAGTAEEQGDFVHGPYEAKLRRNPGRVQLQLVREGNVGGKSIQITKGITLNDEGTTVEIAYLIENLPEHSGFIFAPELNFAGLPSGIDDRYFRTADGHSIGQLGHQLDLHDAHDLGLVDQWLGIDVGLNFDRPTSIWTYPVETVSQSEGGFELVHQSVAVVPHWHLTPDANGCWSVTIRLAVDTTMAEQRMGETPVAASV
jgi:alpha-amylase